MGRLLPALLAWTLLAASIPWARADDAPQNASEEIFQVKATLNRQEAYPVDLATVLRLVDDQNLPLAQDKVNVAISRNSVRQKQAALLPNVEGSLAQNRLEGGNQGFGGEVFRVVRTSVQPQLSASITLYPGGRTVYEILAAKARERVAQSQLQVTTQGQLSQAATEYYRLLAAQVSRDAVLQALKELETQVKANEARFETGKGTYLEVMQSRTALAQQKRQLKAADSAIVLAEQALLNRLNLGAEVRLIPNEAEREMRRLVPDTWSLKELLAEATEHYPGLRKLDEDLKALGIDFKAIRSDLLPSVTLRTFVNGTGPEWSNLTRSTFGGFTVNLNLLENLGLQIPLRLQAKRQEIEKKVLERQALVRNIESEVTTAFANSQNNTEAIQAAQEEVHTAEEAFRLATGRFNAGYGINLDVLNAETALITARSNLIRAVLDYNQTQVALVAAIGRLTPETLVKGVVSP